MKASCSSAGLLSCSPAPCHSPTKLRQELGVQRPPRFLSSPLSFALLLCSAYQGRFILDHIIRKWRHGSSPSFPIWISFISSSCPTAVAGTFSTMLSESGKNECPGLVPGLREKAFSLLRWRTTVAVRFPSGPLIRWEKFPSSTPLVSCFYHRGV